MMFATMGKMIEALAPSSVNVLDPNKPKRTDGLAKQVYAQMREDFMVASPFVLHGENPELLAAAWCIVRETLLTGESERGHKEIIMWAVSESNKCPFCIGTHHGAVKAIGAKDENVEQWARYSFSAEATAVKVPQHHSAEFIGTLVAAHYINRVVSVFVDKKLLPLPDAMDPVTHTMTKIMMHGLIKKNGRNPRGTSLQFLEKPNPEYTWHPEWAQSDQYISKAIAAWSSTIETVAHNQLDSELLRFLTSKINTWQGGMVNGRDIPANDIPANFNRAQHAATILSLLTVMTPYEVEDSDVRAVLKAGWTKENALAIVSWSALHAARRCSEWTVKRG